MTEVPPTVSCPTPDCPSVLTVADDCCWTCGGTFMPGQLYERYEVLMALATR